MEIARRGRNRRRTRLSPVRLLHFSRAYISNLPRASITWRTQLDFLTLFQRFDCECNQPPRLSQLFLKFVPIRGVVKWKSLILICNIQIAKDWRGEGGNNDWKIDTKQLKQTDYCIYLFSHMRVLRRWYLKLMMVLTPSFHSSTAASENITKAAPEKYQFQGATLSVTNYGWDCFTGRLRNMHRDHVISKLKVIDDWLRQC